VKSVRSQNKVGRKAADFPDMKQLSALKDVSRVPENSHKDKDNPHGEYCSLSPYS